MSSQETIGQIDLIAEDIHQPELVDLDIVHEKAKNVIMSALRYPDTIPALDSVKFKSVKLIQTQVNHILSVVRTVMHHYPLTEAENDSIHITRRAKARGA